MKGSLLMAMLMHPSMDTLGVPLGLHFAPADVSNSLLLGSGLLALLLFALIRGGWATNTIGQKNQIRSQLNLRRYLRGHLLTSRKRGLFGKDPTPDVEATS